MKKGFDQVRSFLLKILTLVVIFGVVTALYLLWARPYQLHWGATQAETQRPMPGDELDPSPTFLATRAITIDARPEDIWPWLIQMGYTRAGFYGYDVIENQGSPRGLRSADRILPEFQHFKVGDIVPISGVSQEVFYAIQPGQYLVWAGETANIPGGFPGGFTWALYPLNDHQTRLVSRIRWSYHTISQPGLFSLDLFTELTDHLAVRKILQGIKERVEGHIEPEALVNAEFATYVLSAIVFIGAACLLLIRPLTWQRGAIVLVSGLVWLATWYAPVPFWAGLILVIALIWGLYRTFFGSHQPGQQQ